MTKATSCARWSLRFEFSFVIRHLCPPFSPPEPQPQHPHRRRPRRHLAVEAFEPPAAARAPVEERVARLSAGLAEQDRPVGGQVLPPERVEELPLLPLVEDVGPEDQVEPLAEVV